MNRVRVVNVKGLNKPDQRAAVCYVGRRFAGWPDTPWGNHDRVPCPEPFRGMLLRLPRETVDRLLADLWEACGHGAKPLGCWCCDWNGEGETPGCHAAVWADLLNRKYGGEGVRAAAPAKPTLAGLKCLTVCQPWAWAVFHAGKCVENRSWPTAYRGPLLIHAGKSRAYYDAEDADDWREAYGVELPAWRDMPTGAVVGRVTMVDCVRADPGLPYFLPGRGPCVWAEGPWCWVLADPQPFSEPVPLRGQMGLFDVPDELVPAAFRPQGATA